MSSDSSCKLDKKFSPRASFLSLSFSTCMPFAESCILDTRSAPLRSFARPETDLLIFPRSCILFLKKKKGLKCPFLAQKRVTLDSESIRVDKLIPTRLFNRVSRSWIDGLGLDDRWLLRIPQKIVDVFDFVLSSHRLKHVKR